MAKSLKNMMGAGIGAGTATLINGTVADGLTATGSGQADALILTNDVNVIGTVPLGTGVRLLANPQPGDETLVTNLGANTLAIYPPLGATISGGPVNLPFSLPTGNTAEFIARNGSANWVALASGGGTPTPTTDLLLGFNAYETYYYSDNIVENDLRFAAPPSARPSGIPIPAANYGADGWPATLPGADTAISYVFRSPETTANVVILFTPGVCSAVTVQSGCTIVGSPNLAAGSVTVTPSTFQPGAGGFSLTFTPSGGTLPKVTSALTVGAVGAYAASFNTHVSEASVAGGPIRTMKRTGVELNEGVAITSPSGAFPAARITAATRNALTTGDWSNSDGTARISDGWAMEADVAMAVAANRPLWRPLPWNASNDYYDAIGDVAAAAALSNGLTTYFEVSNEVWNGGYQVSAQAYWEAVSEALPPLSGATPTVYTASISGTTMTVTAITSGPSSLNAGDRIYGLDDNNNPTTITGRLTGTGGTGTYSVNVSQTTSSQRMVTNNGGRVERLAEKTIDVMDRIKARYVAAGAPMSKLKRVYSVQTDTMPTYAALMLDYVPPGKTALKNHIDILSTAPYLQHPGVANASTNSDAFIDAMFDYIDQAVDVETKAAYTAAVARGLIWAGYEGGPSAFIDDATTRLAVHTGSRMYDLSMHLLARLAAVAPSAPYANFALPHLDVSNQSFGILKYSGQAASGTTPKYNAAKDFALGKRKLIALTGTLATNQGAALNSIVGTFKRRTPGSSVAIGSTPSGAFAFVDSTAQVLQVKVADASKFASAGTISWTVTETDSRDAAGPKTTSGSCVVAGGAQWDNTYNAASYTITGSGLVATRTAGSGDAIERATTSHTTGAQSFIVTPGRSSGIYFVGLVNASEINTNFVGATANSIGLFQTDGNVYKGGGVVLSSGATLTDSSPVKCILDTGLVYFQVNNGSGFVDISGQNYGARTGGIAAPTGALYPAVDASGVCIFTLDATNWP